MSKILVADIDLESGAGASNVKDYLEEEEEGGGCNKWRITNLGNASRKEHKYSSFCQSSKRCEKN